MLMNIVVFQSHTNLTDTLTGLMATKRESRTGMAKKSIKKEKVPVLL